MIVKITQKIQLIAGTIKETSQTIKSKSIATNASKTIEQIVIEVTPATVFIAITITIILIPAILMICSSKGFLKTEATLIVVI